MSSTNPTKPKPVEVVIGGKVYLLAGNESEEYIQSVARYLNKKLVELSKHSASGTGIEFTENYPIVLALNIADDLFKARQAGNSEPRDIPSEAASELSQMNDELVERTREIEALKKAIEEKDGAIARYGAAMEKGSAQFEAFKKSIAERDEEIKKLRNRLATANSDIAARTGDKAELEEKLKEKEKQLSDLKIEVGELNRKISDKNQELNNLSTKLSEKNNILDELNKKSAERNRKLNGVNKERDELTVKLKTANMELNSLKKQLEELEKAGTERESATLATLKGEAEELKAKLAKAEESSAKLKARIPTGSAADLQNALNAVKAENSRLSRENEQLLQELNNARNEVKSFIEALK